MPLLNIWFYSFRFVMVTWLQRLQNELENTQLHILLVCILIRHSMSEAIVLFIQNINRTKEYIFEAF